MDNEQTAEEKIKALVYNLTIIGKYS